MTPVSSCSPATGPRCRRGRFAILVVGVILSGCSQFTEELFEQHEVATGPAKRQTVLAGFLLDGAIAELAVVSVDENGERRLRIYEFEDGAWAQDLDAPLRPEVLFVDVANIGGRDRLITCESRRLSWLDPESGSEHELVAVASEIEPPPEGEIPHVDVSRDLNDDGRDDLVVPDFDGFWVFVQLEDGTFARPVKIGRLLSMGRVYADSGYRYDPWDQGRVHEMDYNRDGRSDLVYWNVDHFEVHTQDERGLFAAVGETFTTDVAFDSDDLASLVAPYGVRRRRMDNQPDGNLTGRVLHSMADLNGDGVGDLGVFSLQGGSLWKMHSTYEVHFGMAAASGGTAFAPEAGTVISSRGIPFGLRPYDFDDDGQVDMMFSVINPGIFKAIGMIIGSLVTGSVSVDVDLYRMDGSAYPDKPTARRRIRTYPGGSGKRAAFSPVLIGDINGDGEADLLEGRDWEELRVYLGVPGPDLFARRPQRVAVAVPKEEYTWLVDLNRDGKQDVLMHHRSSTQPHRVTTLIAR